MIVKDKNPEAVEIMLRYLYTLSDCLNIDSIDRISFMQDEDIYAKLPRECEQLGCVLSVASRYGLKVLAETASERLKERFELLKSHSPPDREALEPLTRSLLEVLYSNKDTSVLQTSRDSIVRMLLDQWRHLVPGDMIHTVMLRHPELGYDFARLAMEKIEYQQELMGRMQEDIPQKKRKAWISRRK